MVQDPGHRVRRLLGHQPAPSGGHLRLLLDVRLRFLGQCHSFPPHSVSVASGDP